MSVIRTLLMATAATALCAASASAQTVNWRPDGGADLILDDGAVIATAPGELGDLFGPGEKPFDGAEITVTVNNSGPKGGISGPLYTFRPIWEELTGGKLNIVELPFGEHYTKMMLDLKNGVGQYDAFMVGAFWYGDIAEGNYGFPINDLMESGEYPKWTLDDMPPSLQALHVWGDDVLGTLNDADGQVLYFRKDVLTDPVWNSQFKAENGYDIPVPPQTWQQVLEISNFFNGKNWDSNDADPDSGTVLHLKVGEQGHYHFQSLSASFVLNPGDEVTQHDNVYWFDPTDMTPLINGPGHVAALEFLQELHKTGPSAQVGWSLGEAWDYFLRGKSVFVFSWGDVGSLVQDEDRSLIKGRLGSSILPISEQYWDLETEAWVDAEPGRTVGNTTGGSWHGVVSAYSDNPEATYSLLALMAIKPVSMWNASYGWTGVDPGYSYQFLEPLGQAKVEDYVAADWNADDVVDYTQAYYDTFYAPVMMPYLRIPGTFEYWDILDKNLSATMAGEFEARQALDATAAAWEEVTDRLDRAEQLRLYQDAIGYGG